MYNYIIGVISTTFPQGLCAFLQTIQYRRNGLLGNLPILPNGGEQLRGAAPFSILQAADPHAGPKAEPKAGVQGLGEGGVDPVEEGHRGVGGGGVADAVEGQHPRWRVQVHAHPRGARPRQFGLHRVVPEDVSGWSADEAPGLVVEAEQALVPQAFPADALVGHHGLHATLAHPLELPVGFAAQRLAAEHLRPVVKALGVLRQRLVLIGGYGF